MKCTVGNNEELRNLCIEENWFTHGSIQQYEKLFYANQNQFPFAEIVTIIWLCSDDKRENIRQRLIEFNDYYKEFFNEED